MFTTSPTIRCVTILVSPMYCAEILGTVPENVNTFVNLFLALNNESLKLPETTLRNGWLYPECRGVLPITYTVDY